MNLLKKIHHGAEAHFLSSVALKQVKTVEKCIYITFDDGPEADITEFVLSVLDEYNAKATFFCCGENITRNKNLYYELLKKGHSIGNHTITHLKGRHVFFRKYINEVLSFQKKYGTSLFRPPFMSLSFFQILYLSLFTKIVLWNVDSTDWYDKSECEFDIDNLVNATCNGSIVLFHFCQKHQKRTRNILPLYLKVMYERGYSFKAL